MSKRKQPSLTYYRYDFVPGEEQEMTNRRHWAVTGSQYAICGALPQYTSLEPLEKDRQVKDCGHCVKIIEACKSIEL